MTFSEFMKAIKPCTEYTTIVKFFSGFFEEIISDGDNYKIADGILIMDKSSCEKWFNGSIPFPTKRAVNLLPHIDKEKLVGFFSAIPYNCQDMLIENLLGYGISVDENNLADTCTEIFINILKECANRPRQKSSPIEEKEIEESIKTTAGLIKYNSQAKFTDIEAFFSLIFKLVDFSNFSIQELQIPHDIEGSKMLADPSSRRFYEESLSAFGQTYYTPNARSLYTNNIHICTFLDALKTSGGKVEFKELVSSFKHLKISRLSGDIVSSREYEKERKDVYLYSDITEEDWELLSDETHETIYMREEEWDETNGEPKKYIGPTYIEFYMNEDRN